MYIYFTGPGTPSHRDLNENSNSLLRRHELPKEMDFNLVDQNFVSAVADKQNRIPRNSLNYQTLLEAFLSYFNGSYLSSLYWQFRCL